MSRATLTASEAKSLAGPGTFAMLPDELRRPLDVLPAIDPLPDSMTIGELRQMVRERFPAAFYPLWRGDLVDTTNWLANHVERLPDIAKAAGRRNPVSFVFRAQPDVAAATHLLMRGVLLLPTEAEAETKAEPQTEPASNGKPARRK